MSRCRFCVIGLLCLGLPLLLLALYFHFAIRPGLRCADQPGTFSEGADGVHMGCKELVALCVAEGEQGDGIRRMCPETCGMCPAKAGQPAVGRTCADSPSLVGLVPKASQLADPTCPDAAAFCKDPNVKAVYATLCPKTCGVCREAARPPKKSVQGEEDEEEPAAATATVESAPAKMCADTEGVVSTSQDGVNLKCANLVAYCIDPDDRGDGIRRICPETCGLCTSITPVCKDSPRLHGLIPNLDKAGAEGATCHDLRDFCQNDMMEGFRKACPQTCGQCPAVARTPESAEPSSAGCSDKPGKVTDGPDGRPITCSQLVAFCVDPAQGPGIRSRCPATCGACPGSTGPYTCADTPRPYELQPGVEGTTCKDLKKLCKDEEEGEAVRQLCPATCKVCKKTKSASATASGAAKEGKEKKSKKAATATKEQEPVKKKKPVAESQNKGAAKAASQKAAAKHTVKRHKQPDVAYLSCEVCTHMVAAAVRASMEFVPTMTGEDKYSRIVGGVCEPKNIWARWVKHLDIQYDGHEQLRLEHQAEEGECKSECATLKKTCFHVLRDREEDLEEMLLQKAKPQDMANSICGGHCDRPPKPFKPPKGWVDEVFVPRDPELVKTELMAEERNLHLPPGAPQSQVWNLQDIMAMSPGDQELWMAQQQAGRNKEKAMNTEL